MNFRKNMIIFIIEFMIQKYNNNIAKYIKLNMITKILLNIVNKINNYNINKFQIYLNNQYKYYKLTKIIQLIQIKKIL